MISTKGISFHLPFTKVLWDANPSPIPFVWQMSNRKIKMSHNTHTCAYFHARLYLYNIQMTGRQKQERGEDKEEAI